MRKIPVLRLNFPRLGKLFVSRLVFFANTPPKHDIISYLGHYKKNHTLFCYYAIKRQISTKLIGENMFCMKAHQLSIVLPSKSILVQLRIYTSYTKTCFFLGVTCYFSRITYFWSFVLFRCYDFIRSLYYF